MSGGGDRALRREDVERHASCLVVVVVVVVVDEVCVRELDTADGLRVSAVACTTSPVGRQACGIS